MAFIDIDPRYEKDLIVGGYRKQYLHTMECRVCPLASLNNKTPHMEPTGNDNPTVYFLGDAPNRADDQRGKPFSGRQGMIVRSRVPTRWRSSIRFNNCVRTKPEGTEGPGEVEIECCRPSVVRDIEETKPVAIFGFGAIPLKWMLQQSGIMKWSGRKIPVQVGSHRCWFFPFMHPGSIDTSRKFDPRSQNEYGSELEFAFAIQLKQAFEEIEQGLPKPIIHTEKQVTSNTSWITHSGMDAVRRIGDFLETLWDEKVVGLDYETNAIRPYGTDARILTTALASKDHAFAFPLRHSKFNWSPRQLKEVEKLYQRFLYEAPCRKVVHNLAFEMEWTGFFFGEDSLRAQPWGDSLLQAYLIDERLGSEKPGALSLEFLCLQYFGFNLKALGGVDVTNLDNTDPKKVMRYNAMDAKYHRLLFLRQGKEINRNKLVQVYRDRLPRIPTMVLSQLLGVPIDKPRVDELRKKYERRLSKAEGVLKESKAVRYYKRVTGKEFDVASNKHVHRLFRDVLGVEQEDDDGRYSVNENFLQHVEHPVGRKILQWRKPQKILSTYITPLGDDSTIVYKENDGYKIHPILSTTRTRTNRTSSEDPNIQNWPKRDELSKEVRSVVKAPDGYVIVAFDYAGIQARNIAMESLDDDLIQAFHERYDIHSDWMLRIAKAYPRWASNKQLNDPKERKALRHRAKNEFVFPSFFGAKPNSISANLGVPKEKVEKLQEDFWGAFPSIKEWQDGLHAFYRQHGYVTGLSGYRRHAPVSPNEIINSPIQADETFIVCDAMNRLSEMDWSRFQAAIEVHDDLTFIWPEKEAEERAEVVATAMCSVPYDWANVVPIVVEVEIGKDWANMKEVGEVSSDLLGDNKHVRELNNQIQAAIV